VYGIGVAEQEQTIFIFQGLQPGDPIRREIKQQCIPCLDDFRLFDSITA
jgi:hypothetical protein